MRKLLVVALLLAGCTSPDDSAAQGFSISASPATVSEGTKHVTFTISRTSSRSTATVQFATQNGTAKAGSDYGPFSERLRFPAGTSTLTRNVGIIDDNVAETTEEFTGTLRSNSGQQLAVTTVTITDNDGTPPPPDPNPPPPNPPPGNWTVPPGVGGDTAPWLKNGGKPPGSGYQGVAWIIAVADTRRTDAGWVEIDYFELRQGDTVLARSDYSAANQLNGSGGDFGERNLNGLNWFTEHNTIAGFSTFVKAFTTDAVVIQPSDYRNYGAHMWAPRSGTVPTTASAYAAARIKNHGSCVVELGVDFHSSNGIENSSGTGFTLHGDDTDWRIVTSPRP